MDNSINMQGLNWEKEYAKKLVSTEEAAGVIKSGDRVFMPLGNGAPTELGKQLAARMEELENVDLYSGVVMYPYDFLRGKSKGHVNYHSFFFSPLERRFHPEGNIDTTSVSISELGDYFIRAKLNVVIMEVSVPDDFGYMSFGPCGGMANTVPVQTADTIIVQANKQTPYVYGSKDTFIHVSEVDYICETDQILPEWPNPPVTDLDRKIASYIVEEVPDGACIQTGIGGLPNAVCELLAYRKNLGIHTEMLVDGLLGLYKKGAITNRQKSLHPGKMVFTAAGGNQDLYKFMHRNQDIEMRPGHYVNNPQVIGQNDNLMAINSALMVDLTGQVCSESIGFVQHSGTGGQLDYAIGANISRGGKFFIALPSTIPEKKTGGIASRIVSTLPPGTVVTTPRSLVQYIVTEYGIADLKNRSISQRVKAVINIAHPEVRDQLYKEAREKGLLVD